MLFSTVLGSKKKNLKLAGYIFGIFYLSLTGGGGCNLFGDFGNNNSDDAIIFHATQQLDASNWSGAISTLGTVSTGGQTQSNYKELLASAYAGRGGLNLISLSQDIQNAPSTLTFFQLLMVSRTGATAANINDLITAEGIMQTIALNGVNRTADENILMLFIEIAKLGSILSNIADTNADGILDPTFDSCLDTSLPNADQIVTAISNIIDSAQSSGSTVGASLINGISADCGKIPGVCNVYQVANVTGPEEILAQTLVGETALGIGLAVPSETGICEIPPNGTNCHLSATGLCP
jgi:hypothetical protein